jgi:hypothetical protein
MSTILIPILAAFALTGLVGTVVHFLIAALIGYLIYFVVGWFIKDAQAMKIVGLIIGLVLLLVGLQMFGIV